MTGKIRWFQSGERMTGLGNKNATASGLNARPDTINRPLRDMLEFSGFDPDATFPGLPTPTFNIRAFYDATVATTWESAFAGAAAECKSVVGGKVAGGQLDIPPGIYPVNAGITIDALNMHLVGQGRYTARIIGAGFAGPIVTVTSRTLNAAQLGTSLHNLSAEQAVPLTPGSIGFFLDMPFDCAFSHCWARDCEIGWKVAGAIYTQWDECDATSCTTSVRMMDATFNSNSYPCNLYEWRGGRLWAGTQAIVSDTNTGSGFWKRVNVSGVHAGSLACVDFSNVGQIGFGPGIVFEEGYFEANTSSLAEFQYSGSVFSPTEINNTTFISANVARGVYVKQGEVHLTNTQGVPLTGGAPNLRLDAGTRCILIGTAPAAISVDGGASITQMSSSALSVGAATITTATVPNLNATTASISGAIRLGGGVTTQLQRALSGTVTWDPASLAAGASTSTTVTVTGAAVTDAVLGVSLSTMTAGGTLQLTGYVSAANTVTCVLTNLTGGTVDLASGTLRATVVTVA